LKSDEKCIIARFRFIQIFRIIRSNSRVKQNTTDLVNAIGNLLKLNKTPEMAIMSEHFLNISSESLNTEFKLLKHLTDTVIPNETTDKSVI